MDAKKVGGPSALWPLQKPLLGPPPRPSRACVNVTAPDYACVAVRVAVRVIVLVNVIVSIHPGGPMRKPPKWCGTGRRDFLPSPAVAEWWQAKTDPEGARRRRILKAVSGIMTALIEESRRDGSDQDVNEVIAEILCVAHIVHVDLLRVVGDRLGENRTKLYDLELEHFRRSLGMEAS
jgi:hypothetical protein